MPDPAALFQDCAHVFLSDATQCCLRCNFLHTELNSYCQTLPISLSSTDPKCPKPNYHPGMANLKACREKRIDSAVFCKSQTFFVLAF